MVKRRKLQHRAFRALVVLKGFDGIVEICGGAALIFVHAGTIYAVVTALTAKELSEDPSDLSANLLRRWAAAFGQGAQAFASLYLIVHGIAKAALAGCLLLGKTWAYPMTVAFLAVFIAYAGFRLCLGWSSILCRCHRCGLIDRLVCRARVES